MIHISLTFPSKALLRPVHIVAGLPDEFSLSRPPWKVVWALHCAMDDGQLFFAKLNASRLIDQMGFALIAPNLGNNWFCNSDYEEQSDFLNEILDALPDLLPLSRLKNDNIVLGVSMGGYGAILWALSANRFSKAISISGVFDPLITPDERIRSERAQKAILLVLNKNMKKYSLNEQLSLAMDKATENRDITQVILYCGEQDFLALPQNLALEKKLAAMNIPVSLNLEAGGHDLAFWQHAFSQALHSIFSSAVSS